MKNIYLFPLMMIFFVSTHLQATQEDPNEVVAEVDGKKITMGEINKALATDLYEAQTQIYQMKKMKIDEQINQHVLEKEANRKKMTVPELLEKNVQKKIKKVSDKEVDKFYKENQQNIKGTKEQFAERIRNYLEQQNYREQYSKYVESLKKSANAKILIKKPERIRVELSLSEGPQRGKKDAKIKLVEFSDFECPVCKRYTKTLDAVYDKYKRKINFVFKAFPLDQHKKAPLAHQASFCAEEQGKFWPYHDLLFENSPKLDRTDLEQYAQKARLDLAKFKQCLDSGSTAAKMQTEMQEAMAAGVRATPTIFINGQMLIGAVSQAQIEEVIEEELKRN